MDIGQRVREIRKDLGMPAAELARRTGVARNTIVMIEAGSRTPSVGLLEKIARELRTEPSELLKEPVPLEAQPETRLIRRTIGPDEVGVSDDARATIFGHLDRLEAALKTHGLNGELVDMIEQMRKKVAV